MSTINTSLPLTPPDFPPFQGELDLTCSECELTGAYEVGHIFVDPGVCNLPRGRRVEEFVGFSAYFRCPSCNAPGPWRFPKATERRFLDMQSEFAVAAKRR